MKEREGVGNFGGPSRVESSVKKLLVLVMLAACSSPSSTPLVAAPTTRPAEPAEPPSLEPPEPSHLVGAWTDLGAVEDADHLPRRVRVWMPEHEGPVPVLVVLDGGGAEDWFALPDALIRLVDAGRLTPWAVLAIDSSSERNAELGRADARFVDFVADTILPLARSRVSLLEGPENTAIHGYSYGGLQAVVAVARRPEVFGRAIAQSPSLWVEARAALTAFERGRRPVRLFIDVGTRESGAGEILGYMLRDARDLRDVALNRGMVLGRDLGYFEAVGEEHDMAAGGRRIEPALAFALGDVDLTEATPVDLTVMRHSAVRGRSAFSITLGYADGCHLTIPARLAEVTTRGAPFYREVVTTDRALSVRAHGLEARCE